MEDRSKELEKKEMENSGLFKNQAQSMSQSAAPEPSNGPRPPPALPLKRWLGEAAPGGV
jgi:hypothetical protein